MKISRITMISLGVNDLPKATEFYRQVLSTTPNTSSDAITFIELSGSWLTLYPLAKLAEDISPDLSIHRSTFSGITLAHNARSKDEVVAILDRAKSAGARIVKEPQDTFWGGFSGYFADLDGYFWEVAWGPMFEFKEDGDMKFKEKSLHSI
jgi:hypothetical protein